MALFQYSASNIGISINPSALSKVGKFTVFGYGEDEFLTVELNDDNFSTVQGADGVVVRSYKKASIANMTLTLQQTSTSNVLLSALLDADKNLLGSGIFAIAITIPPVGIGNVTPVPLTTLFTQISCATAYISKMADFNYGKESGERGWSITLVDPIFDKISLEQITAGTNYAIQSASQVIGGIF